MLSFIDPWGAPSLTFENSDYLGETVVRFKAMRHLGVSSPANSCGGAHQLCAIPVQSGGLSSILRWGVPRLQKSKRLSPIWPSGAPRVLRGACLSSIDPWGAPKMTFGVYNIICPKRQRRSTGRCSGRTLNIIRAHFFQPPSDHVLAFLVGSRG